MDDIHFYEHNLNIPLMAEWRVPLGRELSVFVNGGISMDCGLRAECVREGSVIAACLTGYMVTFLNTRVITRRMWQRMRTGILK